MTRSPGSATLASLAEQFGPDSVQTDAETLDFYARDVFAQGEQPLAVIRPSDAEALCRMVRSLAAAGIAMLPRGGGLSYTDGYLSDRPGAVVIDTARLDRIIEINETDRYVIAECGVTWEQLYRALAERGLRTPYFGPLSGLHATVGGALSQGSVFLGSGQHGSVGDSVLGIDIVTAEGQVLQTGAAAAGNTPPFFRYFGPDLTGLFVGDAGSLGIKLRASLRLIPRPDNAAYSSWQFDDAESMLTAMADIARSGVAAECFGFDPVLAGMRLKRASLSEDAGTLRQVIREQGLLAGLKVAGRGRSFLDPNRYSLHATLETGCGLSRLLARRADASARAGRGRRVSASIPRAMRALPFVPPNTMLGPEGQRWVPVHGILPHSQAPQAFSRVRELLASEHEMLAANQIETGCLFATVGAQATLIEPVFYWPDAHTVYHRRMVDPDYRQRVGEPAANPEATTAMSSLKARVAETLRAEGATHFQIGRFYSYRAGRNAAALAAFDAIKHHLDPDSVFNPGVLP